MQNRPKGPLALAIVMITLGVGLLLTVLGYGGGIDWVWTLSLAVMGAMTFVLSGGVDKVSIVIGPAFLVASILSVLRQRGMLETNVEVPIFIIFVGVMLLVAQMRAIPMPRWIEQTPEEQDEQV